MQLFFFLILLAGTTHASVPVTFRDLMCDTALVVAGSTTDDVAPHALITARSVPVIFSLGDELKQLVYVRFLNATLVVRSSTTSGGIATAPKLWNDILPAVTSLPGQVAQCLTVPGCDGFIFDAVLFLRLFPKNATGFEFSFRVEWLSDNGTVRIAAPIATFSVTRSRIRVAAVAPASATSLGTSDLVSLTMNMSQVIVNEAFPQPYVSDVDNTFWYALGGALGGAVFLILLFILCFACMRPSASPAATAQKQVQVQQELQPLRSTEVSVAPAPAPAMGGRHGRFRRVGY